MKKRRPNVPADPADLRTKNVHLRLTPAEFKVLDAICQVHGNVPKTEMARTLMVLGVPRPIPEFNQEAFKQLAEITSAVYEIREFLDECRGPVLPEFRVGGTLENALARLRSIVVGVA